jgi:transposase
MAQRVGATSAAPADERAAVAAALRRRDLAPRVRERRELVKAAALGHDVAATAAWSGRPPRTGRRWLRRFAAGGVAALAAAPRPGRPPAAGAAYRPALAGAVDPPPPARGLPCAVWTAPRLGAYLAERTGVRLAPGWLRARLARRRCAGGRPTHPLGHLQDPAEVAACAAELAAAGGKGGGGPRARRAAPPGRGAPGDHPGSLPGLAPHGPPAAAARRRHE